MRERRLAGGRPPADRQRPLAWFLCSRLGRCLVLHGGGLGRPFRHLACGSGEESRRRRGRRGRSGDRSRHPGSGRGQGLEGRPGSSPRLRPGFGRSWKTPLGEVGGGAPSCPSIHRPGLPRPQPGHPARTVPLGVGRSSQGPFLHLVRAVPPFVGTARSSRHPEGRGRPTRVRRRDGIRRAVPAAHPSDRSHQPQGRQQRARGRTRRPGRAVGDRLGGRRPHRHPPRAGNHRRLQDG
ncbi:MAG: hypothetical protein KatS3mg011_0584 [Acidimicrobiia bacterium]|nr:MAG: hypothetical protein KatS3mg011_0584 [Acidimicrobiia bacterium]